MSMTLYLASASPRRKALLEQVGLKPRVLPSRVPEARKKGEEPQAMVLRLAQAKAAEVAVRLAAKGVRRGWVLAADTTVAVGAKVLEKPAGPRGAASMLKALSGKAHFVYTGVCLMDLTRGGAHSFVEATQVFFRRLGADEIAAYVATGEPLDKAGAYGIQGAAAAFVSRIEGDYCNVVGLPLAHVVELLNAGAR
jgi:septum formation protein